MNRYGANLLIKRPHLRPVVDYIREHPDCTAAEAGRALGVDIGKGDVIAMHNNGLIRKVRSTDNGARWSA